MGADDAGPDDTRAADTALAAVPDDETTVVPDPAPTGRAELAWSFAEPPEPKVRHPLPRPLLGLLAAVLIAALALGSFVLGRRQQPAPPGVPAAAPSTPARPEPPKPLLNGVYQIVHDWEHQTYRNNRTHTGRTVRWEHDKLSDITWWAFVPVCSDTECVAIGAKLDDESHLNSAVPGGSDVLRLVNGAWQDMTPYLSEVPCTDTGNGATMGKTVNRSSWGFQPLPDGSFQGSMITAVETDGCGDEGNTWVVPLIVTRIADVPLGVLLQPKIPK